MDRNDIRKYVAMGSLLHSLYGVNNFNQSEIDRLADQLDTWQGIQHENQLRQMERNFELDSRFAANRQSYTWRPR